jgi:outer membrane receptor for ferrienterochelin and colicin
MAAVVCALLIATGALAAEKVDPALKRLAKVMQPGDGVLRGKVLSQETGELLPAASIYVQDPKTNALVKGGPGSLDGEYELVVPAGTYNVKVSYISYADNLYKRVVIEDGKVTKLDLALKAQGDVQGEEILVEAKLQENTEESVLLRQQRSPSVSDGISAEQISKTSDSDAAEALKRVTGVSIVDNKWVYVRGLGDRYQSTQLNGARMTSTESKRVVALDIVPAKLLDNVITQKTYSSDQWAEFAGGVVQVNTKDFPDQFAGEASVTVGLEPSSTFKSFRSYPGGHLDWLGHDDGRRALPDLIQEVADDQKVVQRGRFSTTGFTPDELKLLGESFENVWDPSSDSAPVNQGYNISLGDQVSVGGRPLGVIGSLTYGGSYDERAEEENSYTSTATGVTPYSSYQVERSRYGVDLGGLLNFSYRLTPDQRLSWRNTYTRNGEDEVRVYEGITPNLGPEEPIRDQRLRFIERDMFATRVEGEHLIKPLHQSVFNWRVGYSQSNRVEPDTREVIYKLDPVGGEYRLWDSGQSGQRFFSDLNDQDLTSEFQVGIPLPGWKWQTAKLDVGAFYSDRDRDFLARRFRFVPKSQASNPDSVDLTLPAEEIYVADNLSPTRFQLQEETRNTDAYTAQQVIKGAFVNGDFGLSSRFRLIAGLRIEDSNQQLQTFELGNPAFVPVVVVNQKTQPAPAASLIYKMSEQVNLRFAASRTVNRPDFRELAPFEYTEFVGGRTETGDTTLVDASIQSYDVRFERYPGLGEMEAVSFFYKDFDQPIEVVVKPGVSRIVSYANTEGARNYGVELEYRQGLGRYLEDLKRFNLGLNLTLVKSQVQLGDSPSVNTSKERALQGQSPYVVNGTLAYAFPDDRTQATLLYNVFGRRITSVGANGLPDIYERARNSLDLTASTSFNHHMRLKFVAKELLNHQHRFTQAGQVTQLWTPGRSFALSFTYAL